jgi:hypothetical protein
MVSLRGGCSWKTLGVVLIGLATSMAGCQRRADTSTQATSPVPNRDEAVDFLAELPAAAQQALIHGPTGELLRSLFRDETAESGVHSIYRNGEEAGNYSILESLGGGVALLDYDGDGLLDIFVTGGGYYDGPDKKQIKGYPCKLYKNLGGWHFKDVTKDAGLAIPWFYSHGCAVADYDRDGWPDMLVTGWHRLALFHNEPDGRGGRHFREVTREAGLPEGLWSTSAAWGDLDGDGYPDLYVCQYLDWSFAINPRCPESGPDGVRDICPPRTFRGLPHHLFRNDGHGHFIDVSKEAGLRPHTGDATMDGEDAGRGLGVLFADVNGDGKPDIYTANDGGDNFLYLNRSSRGKLRFEEVGLRAGVARDDHGLPDGSMGVDVGDYDGSGRASIWVTNYENEMHALYRNLGRGLFRFSTPAAGIAAIGQLYVGFGTGFLDLDNHGWEDLVIANGHVLHLPPRAAVRQRPVLLRNEGSGHFTAITPQGGPYFRSDHMGRGLAIGDLDNDGLPDLVISHVNDPVVLLHNEAKAGNHWLGIELVGQKRRDVVGARVIVEVGGRRLVRFAKGGGSYLSSGDRRLLFGLGRADHIERVTVDWPWEVEQSWDGSRLPVDRYWRLVEGKPEAEPCGPSGPVR